MPSIQRIFEDVSGFLVAPYQKKTRVHWLGSLVFLYLLGSLLWGSYFNWGRWPVTFNDWQDVTAPRLTFLKNAITSGQLPLHSDPAANLGGDRVNTNRYLAIPDAILSPQLFLLRYLSINQFALFQVLLLYSLGFLGLVLLGRKLGLSPLAFGAVFFLYNFNGHILAHLTAGHLVWCGYFLFSWFALFVFELLEGQAGWRWAAKTSILLFLILLQGSYHPFAWLLLFTGLLGLVFPRRFWLLLATAVFAVLLSLVRLLPVLTLAGSLDASFLAGYPDLLSILNQMVRIQLPGVKAPIDGLTASVGTWETSLYVGVIGAAFLIYFGIYKTLSGPQGWPGDRALLLACAGLAFLSLEKVIGFIGAYIPLPLITGERVATRLAGLPFVFLLMLAAIQFQKWLDAYRNPMFSAGLSLVLGFFGLHNLYENFWVWSLPTAAETFKYQKFNPAAWGVVNNFGDSQYIHLLLIGMAATLFSLIGISWLAWRERRKTSISPSVEAA